MKRDDRKLIDVEHVGFTYTTGVGFYGGRRIEALRDITFSVREGETVGLIGRNGCGKSTLLRLLTGIFREDRGRIIRYCDRISLLSLSLGFDRNLSGLDNLVLSCMFLGASRREALAMADEIIQFSGLGDYIHEPLKSYSSGMKARLGFSVGLKMHADLMLIDEVLGVGDASFRKKAQAAMKELINSDQSVIYVTHNMGNVLELCNRVIWLEDGAIREEGDPERVVEAYSEFMDRSDGVGRPPPDLLDVSLD